MALNKTFTGEVVNTDGGTAMTIDRTTNFSWSGTHTFNQTGSFTVASSADILLNATDGLGIAAGFSVANVTTGDLMLNATSGIGIFAGFASAEVSMSVDDISIGADAGVAITAGVAAITNVASGILLQSSLDISLTPGDDLIVTAADFVSITATAGSVDMTAGIDVVANATDDVILTAGDNIALTAGTQIVSVSPHEINHRFRFTSIVSSTMNSGVNDFDVSTANVARLTPATSQRNLTGMVAGADGQIVLIANASSTIGIRVVDETDATNGTDSVAANRFNLTSSTSQTIGPRGLGLFWYDGTSDRWRGQFF